jgi:LPXTG-motif cell wall-anchored protein
VISATNSVGSSNATFTITVAAPLPPAPNTPTSTSTGLLAKTGTNLDWQIVTGILAAIGGAGFLTVSRRMRIQLKLN